MSVPSRSTTYVKGRTLFSSEGILSRAESVVVTRKESDRKLPRADPPPPIQIHKKCPSDDHLRSTFTSRPWVRHPTTRESEGWLAELH